MLASSGFLFFILCFFKTTPSDTVVLGIFGVIFSLLKLKLDNANYQKSLFEERFTILKECDEILFCCFHEKSQNGQKVGSGLLNQKLDSFYRKSYFLFNSETNSFLTEFRKAVLDYAFGKDSNENTMRIEAKKFLADLVNKQSLAEHFKELKIAHYI